MKNITGVVNEEVLKWIKERNYIFFSHQHFDANVAAQYFEEAYQKKVASLKARGNNSQIEAIKASLKQQGYSAAETLNIAGALQYGSLMEDTLTSIGEVLDNLVQQYYHSGGEDIQTYLNSIATKKSSYNALLANGAASPEAINEFFNFLLQGLRLLGEVDADILNAFTDIGQKLSANGKQFIFIPNDTTAVKTASAKDVQRCKDIVGYLEKSAKILAANGFVSEKSFSGTLTNIFSATIGEQLAQLIITKAVEQADELIVNELLKDKHITINKNGIYSPSGKAQTIESGITSKPDLINSAGFKMRVTANGSVYNIELMSNMSVKTHSISNKNIKMVDKTPFGKYYPGMGTDEGYYAYNVMAHRKSPGYQTAYANLRSHIAASFLDGWLSGSGETLDIGGIDKVQFLMINGRIYSVSEIISLICDKMMARQKPVSMSIEGRDSAINVWQGKGANAEEAKLRSDASREAINALVISAHFNSNMLKTIIP